MFDWNDVKALLAVARGGSTAAAARELGVNQTTVARRLEALEKDFGVKLVDRSQSGASLTEAGLCLVADAEGMERAALAMRQRIEAHRRGVTGTLRVTLSEMTANVGLIPLMPEFRQAYPDLTLELVISDTQLDLKAGEADVAIRGAASLTDSDLVARKVSETNWALYCSRDYAARMGLPATERDLKDHMLIGGERDDMELPGMSPILHLAPEAEITLKSNSLTNLFGAVRAGLGIGPMPCIMADMEPDLVQVFPPQPAGRSYTWIVTRADLKDTPRVRAFLDFFAPRMIALSRDFEARGAALKASRRP